MKNVVMFTLILSVSCSSGSQNPQKRGAVTPAQNTTQQQAQTGDGSKQEQVAPIVKNEEEKKPEVQTNQDCQINKKFGSIFSMVVLAANTLLKDADQRTLGALAVLKQISDNISNVQSGASYEQFAKDLAASAKTQFSDLSDGDKLAIDVGVAAAVKAINLKCTQQSGDFSVKDVVSFASEIIKTLPADVKSKVGDFDLGYIELLVKGIEAFD